MTDGVQPASAPAHPAVNGTTHLPPPLYNFATHNEDARVEITLVNHLASKKASESAGLRVLSVTACGTHTIAFCSSKHVQTVDAVDVSPSQVMLSALTAAAATALDTPEALIAFLGQGSDAISRLNTFRAAVRPLLAPDVAAFWDEHTNTIEAGIMSCGGAERFYAQLRAQLPTLDLKELRRQPRAVTEAACAAFSVENARVNMPMMPAALLEKAMRMFRASIPEGLNKYLCTVGKGGTANVFAHFILTGQFPMEPDHERPLFLQREVLASAKALGCGSPRLQFHAGLIQEVAPRVAAEGRYFDVIDVSNIFDMLPSIEHGQGVIGTLADCLAPGGALLGRWAGVPPYILPDLLSKAGLLVDADLSARLLELETCHTMKQVCVGFKP